MLCYGFSKRKEGNVKLFFKRNNKKGAGTGVLVQSAPKNYGTPPFSILDSCHSLNTAEFELYTALREAIPVVDGAIGKLVRLTGDFTVHCRAQQAEKGLQDFFREINVNGTGKGIMQFLCAYLDQLLTYGEAVGEIVTDGRGREVAALYNTSLKDVTLKRGNSPLEVLVCSKGVSCEAYPYQELLMPTLLNPEPGRLRGTSVLKGLPFVSSILVKIFNAVGTNFDRVGNIRFAVTYKPDASVPVTNAREQASMIADEWGKAMRSRDQVCDFVSVGDVSVKVIGADNQVLDCDVPVRHMLEQIVAKLSIPPFLLGLNWSSTERMSSQQTDILTSELEYYRSLLSPVIQRICRIWLRLHGFDEQLEIEWSYINLQDEVELAQARLYNAQAQQLEESLQKEQEGAD